MSTTWNKEWCLKNIFQQFSSMFLLVKHVFNHTDTEWQCLSGLYHQLQQYDLCPSGVHYYSNNPSKIDLPKNRHFVVDSAEENVYKANVPHPTFHKINWALCGSAGAPQTVNCVTCYQKRCGRKQHREIDLCCQEFTLLSNSDPLTAVSELSVSREATFDPPHSH